MLGPPRPTKKGPFLGLDSAQKNKDANQFGQLSTWGSATPTGIFWLDWMPWLVSPLLLPHGDFIPRILF